MWLGHQLQGQKVKGQLVADVLNSQHAGIGATWRINTKILQGRRHIVAAVRLQLVILAHCMLGTIDWRPFLAMRRHCGICAQNGPCVFWAIYACSFTKFSNRFTIANRSYSLKNQNFGPRSDSTPEAGDALWSSVQRRFIMPPPLG